MLKTHAKELPRTLLGKAHSVPWLDLGKEVKRGGGREKDKAMDERERLDCGGECCMGDWLEPSGALSPRRMKYLYQ